MRSSIHVSGFEDLMRNMGVAEKHLDEVVQETIESAAFSTSDFAIKGIQHGAATGTTYYRIQGDKYMTVRAGSLDGPPVAFIPGGGSHNLSPVHTSSSAGEYPASDTGHLASNIEIEGLGKKIVSVGTDVMYGRYLEFGTRKILPRPWLQPSFELALKDVIKNAKKNFHKRFK